MEPVEWEDGLWGADITTTKAESPLEVWILMTLSAWLTVLSLFYTETTEQSSWVENESSTY
jgi:hypothetical protein